MKHGFNKCVLLAAVLFLALGCATMKSHWKDAEWSNTIVAYEEFLRQYPKSDFTDEARRRLEALYFKKAKETNTIEAHEDFLRKYSNHSEAHYLLGVMYERKGYEHLKSFDLSFLHKAINEYERALVLNSNYPDAVKAWQRCKARTHLIQGVEKMVESQPEMAIQEFKMGIEADPNNYSNLLPEMYNNIGNLYNKKGWFGKAVAEFEKAFKIDPNCEALRYNLPYNRGLMYFFEMNDLAKAEESIKSAIKADPNRSKPHNVLGLIYGIKGLRNESISEFRRSIEIDPNDEIANQALTRGVIWRGVRIPPP